MRKIQFIPLAEILKLEFPIYAHTNKNKPKETLQEHTFLCQKYYLQIDQEKRLQEFWDRFRAMFDMDENEQVKELYQQMIDNLITFHDVGKVNPEYQRVVMEHSVENIYRKKWEIGTKHSILSAFIYVNYYMNRIDEIEAGKKLKLVLQGLCLINGMVISKHHSNFGEMQEFVNGFGESEIMAIIENELTERFLFIKDPINKKRLKYLGRWRRFCKLQDGNKRLEIGSYLYGRFLYSILVSCDYYATTEYNSGFTVKDFGGVNKEDQFTEGYEKTVRIQKIRQIVNNCERVGDFTEISDINQLRTEMFLEVEENLKRNLDAPIYYIEAPTGSGKSNTAMNVGFQLLDQGYQKLYYVYPFNTLVEQNLITLEDVFGKGSRELERIAVINSNTPIKQEMLTKNEHEILEDHYIKALLDRQFLNYPFILTTHVTIFQTMFSSAREALFGFLQLKDSIVILDEIQSYKNTIWSEIIIFLKVYAELLNMKIIIMSATLPDLNYLSDDINDAVHLLTDTKRYFKHEKFQDRVTVSYELLKQEVSLEQLKEHLLNNYDGKKKIVIEFIKKKRAYEFIGLLREELDTKDLLLLTGDDNRADRLKKIAKIKESERGLILVATQVIEAGVDIDMDIGYKDISKLDSEEQFMGRINRSCKKTGAVYFFNLDDAKGIYSDDYRIMKELTLIDGKMQGVLKEKKFNVYYSYVMEYLKKFRNESMNSEDNLDEFFTESVGKLNFAKVSGRMRLIDDKDWDISVYLVRKPEVDAIELWENYKKLLQNQTIAYSEKQVKLSEIRSKMNNFIYQIKKDANIHYCDKIGELYRIDNGEDYFEEGIFNRERLEQGEKFF